MRSLVVIVLAVACGETPPASTPPLEIAWASCQLATAAREPAQCATARVPYTWDDPGGRTIDVFVKRYGSGGRGQLWLIQGGPGGSGRDFDALAAYLPKIGVDLDVYILDQRGTGLSTRLGCPAQEAPGTPGGRAISADEWPACIAAMQQAHEPTLAGFTVTNTARDLGALIDATRAPDERVFIYAVSYGPYMVNRYLQLFPTQPTGVVLDSICGPGECTFSQADARFDEVARTFLAGCGADVICGSRLGSDPATRLAAIYDALDAGSCAVATAAGLTRATVRRAFAQLLYHWNQRTLIPAIAHRLERCGPQDINVLQRLGALLGAAPTESSLDSFSLGLSFQIALAELWDEPSPSADVYLEREAHQLITNGVGARLAAVHDLWPRAPHDEYFGAWATTAVPMLMLAGSLDPATPLAYQQGAKAAFAGPHQTFVAVPRAGHCVLVESPTTGRPCGLQLVLQFLADPTASLDTSCVASVLPLTFTTSPDAMSFLGTADLWGD